MELSCPISAERINENVVRIIAFEVALIGSVCIYFSNYWAIFFLLTDFALRAFTSGKLSLLKFIAIKIFKSLDLKLQLTDLAPKRFAATLGFVFCLMIATSSIFNFFDSALILTSVMIVFALLESLLGICVGCYVYTFFRLIKRNKKA